MHTCLNANACNLAPHIICVLYQSTHHLLPTNTHNFIRPNSTMLWGSMSTGFASGVTFCDVHLPRRPCISILRTDHEGYTSRVSCCNWVSERRLRVGSRSLPLQALSCSLLWTGPFIWRPAGLSRSPAASSSPNAAPHTVSH